MLDFLKGVIYHTVMDSLNPPRLGSRGRRNKMTKFEITRTDINKVVVKPYEFRDEQAALGEYMSCLMIAGILPHEAPVDALGNGCYRLGNGWELQIRAVS